MGKLSKVSNSCLKSLYDECVRMETGDGEEVISGKELYEIFIEVSKHYLNPLSMAYLHIDMAIFAYVVRIDKKVDDWEKYLPLFYELESLGKFMLGYIGRVFKSDPSFMGMVAEKGVMTELEADIAITSIVRDKGVDVNIRLKALGEFNKVKGRSHKGKRRAEEGLIKELEAIDNSGGIMAIDTDMDYDSVITAYKAKERIESRNK